MASKTRKKQTDRQERLLFDQNSDMQQICSLLAAPDDGTSTQGHYTETHQIGVFRAMSDYCTGKGRKAARRRVGA